MLHRCDFFSFETWLLLWAGFGKQKPVIGPNKKIVALKYWLVFWEKEKGKKKKYWLVLTK